jgi:hypothetical protein
MTTDPKFSIRKSGRRAWAVFALKSALYGEAAPKREKPVEIEGGFASRAAAQIARDRLRRTGPAVQTRVDTAQPVSSAPDDREPDDAPSPDALDALAEALADQDDDSGDDNDGSDHEPPAEPPALELVSCGPFRLPEWHASINPTNGMTDTEARGYWKAHEVTGACRFALDLFRPLPAVLRAHWSALLDDITAAGKERPAHRQTAVRLRTYGRTWADLADRLGDATAGAYLETLPTPVQSVSTPLRATPAATPPTPEASYRAQIRELEQDKRRLERDNDRLRARLGKPPAVRMATAAPSASPTVRRIVDWRAAGLKAAATRRARLDAAARQQATA